MSVILLPQRWRNQPQGKVQLARGFDTRFAVLPSTLTDFASDRVEGAGLSLSASKTRGVNQSGQYIKASFQRNSTSIYPRWKSGPQPGSGSFALLLHAVVPADTTGFPLWSNHGGANQWRIQANFLADGASGGASESGAISLLTYDGTFANIGVSGVVDGKPHTYLFVRSGTLHEIWVDGVRKAVQAMTARNVSGTKSVGPAMYWNAAGNADSASGNYSSAQDCSLFAMLGPVTDPASLSADPWQMFAEDPIRIYFDIGAGGGAAGVTGENSTQSNAGSSGAIQQTHLAGAENSAQANTSTAGAIQQTHLVSSANSALANTSTAGSIQQTQLIGAANSAQSNTSTAGSIQQTHLVSAASSTQSNVGTAGSISTETVAYVTGASSTQANTCTAGAIQQTHLVSAANSTQSNTGTAGSIQVAGAVAVVGADSTQSNTGSAGSIQQTHRVGAANSTCAAVGSAGSILQVHLIICADSTQRATGSAGSIGDVVISDIALAAQRQRNTNTARRGRANLASTGRYNVN